MESEYEQENEPIESAAEEERMQTRQKKSSLILGTNNNGQTLNFWAFDMRCLACLQLPLISLSFLPA